MLGNDFSSANTSPNLIFASPSKTKQKKIQSWSVSSCTCKQNLP